MKNPNFELTACSGGDEVLQAFDPVSDRYQDGLPKDAARLKSSLARFGTQVTAYRQPTDVASRAGQASAAFDAASDLALRELGPKRLLQSLRAGSDIVQAAPVSGSHVAARAARSATRSPRPPHQGS